MPKPYLVITGVWLCALAICAEAKSPGAQCPSTGFNSCEDVQQYRAQAVYNNIILNPCSSDVLDMQLHGLVPYCPKSANLVDIMTACKYFQDAKEYHDRPSVADVKLRKAREKALRTAYKEAEKVELKVRNDRVLLREFLSENKIPRALSANDVKLAISEFAAHIRNAAKCDEKPKTEPMRTFCTYVGNQALNDFGYDFKDSDRKRFELDGNKDQREAIHALLDGAVSPEERFTKVLAAADDQITGPLSLARPSLFPADPSYRRSKLSQYYARMILMFYAARRLEKSDRDQARNKLNVFARKLQLKYNVDEKNKTTLWENMIFHDGYVFGADSKMSQRLFETVQPWASSGADCSTFIQTVVENPNKKGLGANRTNTGAMMKKDWNSAIFETKQLCSEKDLEPGDIVVLNGHTFYFFGYSPYPPHQMLVLEAVGVNYRRVQIRSFDLYGDEDLKLAQVQKAKHDNCQASRFTDRAHVVKRIRGIAAK